jgi:hypothetical protein
MYANNATTYYQYAQWTAYPFTECTLITACIKLYMCNLPTPQYTIQECLLRVSLLYTKKNNQMGSN